MLEGRRCWRHDTDANLVDEEITWRHLRGLGVESAKHGYQLGLGLNLHPVGYSNATPEILWVVAELADSGDHDGGIH